MSVRTRHKSESSLTRYLSESGESAPKELLQSELPTLRAVLLLGLHLQEQRLIDKRNYGQTELAQICQKLYWLLGRGLMTSSNLLS